MPHEDNSALKDLLTTFQADALGQGDANVGANVLASMAVVLANLAPDDGSILTRDHRVARLGVNLLVSGSATCGQVLDEVITEVGRRQTNLAANLRGYLDHIGERREKPGATLPPMGAGSSWLVDAVAATQNEIDPLIVSRTQVWGRILNGVPNERVTDLARRPKFLVAATRPGDLENQLQGLRPGRPLVHLGLGKPGDLAELADPCTALVEGRLTPEAGCGTVLANLLVTDPLQVLGGAAKIPDARTAWLGHLLWLCDGGAGPDAPASAPSPGVPETATGRFHLALDRVVALRLNLPEKAPTLLALDTREAAVRWTAFLREMEPRLPGISYAARNLVSSLVFGLGEMAKIEKGVPVSMAGVEAFARFLVRRMAKARTAMLRAAELAERRSQIERVFSKLRSAPGRTPTRSIYRDLSRLTAADCRGILRWMEAAGLACRADDDAWELVEGADLDFGRCDVPLLEA